MFSRDLLNFALRPFGLMAVPQVRLTLKGAVDEVRDRIRYLKFLDLRGLEIIGLNRPIDPRCSFLADLAHLQYLRLFAGPLSQIEAFQSLKELKYLKIQRCRRAQTIRVDLGLLPSLTKIVIDWFDGADSVFGASNLRSLTATNCPKIDSVSFSRLRKLVHLHLVAGAMREVQHLCDLQQLSWLALSNLEDLASFEGLRDHPSLKFLWLEGCPKLRTLEWLSGLRCLETLRIIDCGNISEISVIRSLPCLRHVHIHGRVAIGSQDTSFLRDMPSLESVVIRGLSNYETEYWKTRNKPYNLLRLDVAGPFAGF